MNRVARILALPLLAFLFAQPADFLSPPASAGALPASTSKAKKKKRRQKPKEVILKGHHGKKKKRPA